MARKTRSDIKIGNLEKKLGLGEGAITNPDGSDARSDKKLGTLRNEFEKSQTDVVKRSSKRTKRIGAAKEAGATVAKSTARKRTPATVKPKAVSADQQIAAKRVVKRNPKAPSSVVKKVRAAIKKSVKK